jgi:hypothetical protein
VLSNAIQYLGTVSSGTSPEGPASSASETSQLRERPFVAVRLRRGVQLPNGRLVGETDRVVHLACIPASAQGDLVTFCGVRLLPEHVEQAVVGQGMPCEPCIVTTPGDGLEIGERRSLPASNTRGGQTEGDSLKSSDALSSRPRSVSMAVAELRDDDAALQLVEAGTDGCGYQPWTELAASGEAPLRPAHRRPVSVPTCLLSTAAHCDLPASALPKERP